MRRPLIFTVLVLALGLGIQSVADAALYRGIARNGARVEFRVEGGKVTFARMRTQLRCVRDGERYRRPYGEAFSPAARPGGGFEEHFKTEEPGYSQEHDLVGKIRSGMVTGHFEYELRYSRPLRTCRTSFSFRAPLQSGAS